MEKLPTFRPTVLGLLILSALAPAAYAQSLQGAAKALDAEKTKAVTFSGKGRWFQFGQAPAPGLPEIYPITGGAHNDAFALVYLPAEKILVEADAFTPVAADAPLPASPNPYSVNLYDNIKKLKLNVEKIAALHGPRLVSLDDLRAAIGATT